MILMPLLTSLNSRDKTPHRTIPLTWPKSKVNRIRRRRRRMSLRRWNLQLRREIPRTRRPANASKWKLQQQLMISERESSPCKKLRFRRLRKLNRAHSAPNFKPATLLIYTAKQSRRRDLILRGCSIWALASHKKSGALSMTPPNSAVISVKSALYKKLRTTANTRIYPKVQVTLWRSRLKRVNPLTIRQWCKIFWACSIRRMTRRRSQFRTF